MDNNILQEQDREVKLELENKTNVEVTEEKQNKFLESTLGKVINTAVDMGLKAILPDLLEDEVVDIKNVMLKCGFKEGINTAINSAINLGKSAVGIVTGKFDNLSQVHTAIKKGGIIDGVSNVVNTVVNQAEKNKLISKGTSKFIKKGKNAILDTVSSNIEDRFLTEVDSLEKISKYIENWHKYYDLKDMDGMKKEYSKIKKQIDNITPLQSTLDNVKKIDNIHTLLKSKGINYELSEIEKELISRFT